MKKSNTADEHVDWLSGRLTCCTQGFFSRNVVCGWGELLLWGEKM